MPIEVFMTAQEIITVRSQRLSDEELLEHLRRLYAEAGELSGFLIDQAGDMPSAAAYRSRFGSLGRAYELIGYRANLNGEQTELNRRLRAMHPEIIDRMQAAIANAGGAVERDSKTDLLRINGELAVSLVLARCQTLDDGRHRWRIRFDPERLGADVTLAVRLDHANETELDYFLLPWLDLPRQEIRLCNRTSMNFECFRFTDLDFFYGMAERAPLLRRRERAV